MKIKKYCYRRSEYGSRTSILTETHDSNLTSRKSLHSSTTDRVKYKLPETDEFNINFNNELLDLITGPTWSLYKVSHSYNLHFTPVKLKQYAARIKQKLATNVTVENEDISFNVKVFKVPILKNNDSCFALKIEVYLNRETKQNVLKFQSILLSWGEYTINNNLCHLPLLMCIGAINITRLVHSAICELLDTNIRSLRISEDDIMWLAVIVNDVDNNKDVVCYDFKLNSTMKSDFSVSCPKKVIKKLWNEIHPSNLEEINFQQVQKFNKQVQCQLISTFGINYEFLRLHRISIGNATISCEGKIKMLTHDAVIKILTFINEISILLDTACPTMSDP